MLRPFLLGFFVSLASCGVLSPEARLERICKNNPEACEVEKVDTSIIVHEYTPIDTQKITNKVDSFIINKDRVITRIYRSYDTLRVMQEQQPDTSMVITKERSVPKNSVPEWVKWVMIAMGNALIIMVFALRAKK